MNRLYKKLWTALIIGLFLISISSGSVLAQTVIKHLVSEATTTAAFYSWDYVLSPATKKVIEYFIVLDDSGHVKTAFNACDVCYGAHKGYSQVGDKMKCNNCGNQYPVSSLGTAGSGGCWPGYIPNTIEGNDIVIQTSDLEKGDYYFLVVSGIHRDVLPSFTIGQFPGEVTVTLSSASKRNFQLVGLNGQAFRSVDSQSEMLTLNVSDLPVGMYVLQITENGTSFCKKLFIY